jgi:DnaJ-class molecular chaperone
LNQTPRPETTALSFFEQDPFSLFGLEPSLNLDEDTLEVLWVKLSRKHHPDRYPAEEKLQASLRLAFIHQCYQTLSGFRSRCQAYIQGCYERETGEPWSNQPWGQELPPGFLEQVFSWNDQKSSPQFDPSEIQAQYDRTVAELKELSTKRPNPFAAMMSRWNTLKYYENLLKAE